MRECKSGVLGLIAILLVSCALTDEQAAPNLETEVVSIEKASQLALEFSKSQFSPPPRRIDSLRDFYENYQFKENADCGEVNRLAEQRFAELEKGLDLFSRKNEVAASIALLAENQFQDGRFREAIVLSITAYEKISSGPVRWERVALASTIGRMYAMSQDLKKAEYWFEKADRDWRRMKGQGKNLWIISWTSSPPGQANIYAVEATIAYLENNLLAEEYYLREILRLVWDIRHSSWASINAADIAAKLSKNLIRQNRFVEAELNALKYDRLSYSFEKSPLLINALSEALLAQGRLEEAEYTAWLAVKMHRDICSRIDGIAFTEAYRTLIKIMAGQGDWPGLMALKAEIELALGKDGRYRSLYGANPDLLVAQLISRSIAPSMMTQQITYIYAEAVYKFGQDSIEALEYDAISAIAWQLSGRNRKALKAYSRSVPSLLTQANTAVGLSRRHVLFRDSYLEFLASSPGSEAALELGIDSVAISFKLANWLNLGSVQRSLSISALKASVKDPELAKSIRELQDIKRQADNLLDLIGFLYSARTDQVDYAALKQLNDKFNVLRKAKQQLEQRIRQAFPAFSQLLSPEPPDIPDLQSSIRTNELLIVYHFGDDRSYAWSLGRIGDLSFYKIDLGKSELSTIVKTLRKALDPQANTLAEIPDFDVQLSYQLYKQLLAPLLESGKNSATDLIVVTSSDLGILPVGLMVTGEPNLVEQKNLPFSKYKNVPWLINNYSVSVLPSATSLGLLRKVTDRTKKIRSNYIGFGDPIFRSEQPVDNGNFNQRSVLAFDRRAIPKTRDARSADLALLPPLPDTREEITSIGAILGADYASDIFLGIRATEDNVKRRDLMQKDVLVFATHGLLPGDLDGLDQPALALTNPEVIKTEPNSRGNSNTAKNDGLLKMEEIIGLRLNADWVILSACNTGAGNGQGADAFSGLGQAFFYAGAKSLLLTNWPVESTSARLLTTGIFEARKENPELTRARALQESIKSLIARNGSDNRYSYAHPIFWAPFSLVGDGGN